MIPFRTFIANNFATDDMKRLICLLLTCFVLGWLFTGCQHHTGQFVLHTPNDTRIQFTNTITESDSVNIFDFANVYNGGGVGVGDFNNDGLEDLYFTGNMVSNKLYLNKGDFEFEDVTKQSMVSGDGIWSRGVAVIDINNDGWKDIYVCATAKENPNDRINKLYVNQGATPNKVPVFKDMAREYGLADTTQSTMAYFFDYDNDNDLDLFIGVNHIIKNEYANTFRKRNLNGEHPSTSKLYRNDWNESLHHGVFTDVSAKAGILIEGYTHAVDIADFNQDGWLDILEANDYISNNVLYINNRDGTFTDRVMEYFKHTAANSMGSDAVDINNDGLQDVIEVDMAPQDNLRKKMFQAPISYQTYQNSDQFGYQYQYTRNMLQLNMGPAVGANDSVLHPVFGDVGYYAGIAETDWSWCPLVADFDQDGNKDIIFTNGFPKDITDRDYITYRTQAMRLSSKSDMLSEIPEVKIHNYAYQNKGNVHFADVTTDWGLETPSFSNGAVYADLDNDGDLDMVINNIADPAMVYENKINEGKADSTNYLVLQLKGNAPNIDGIGTQIKLYHNGTMQLYQNTPYRGYLSTQTMRIHAGLGNNKTVDSLVVVWPDRSQQTLVQVKSNQVLLLKQTDAKAKSNHLLPSIYTQHLFSDITLETGITYTHEQYDFIDFNIQKLLPHKFSEYAPAIATGDINGDGLTDFITGGSPGYSAMEFLQQPNGKFVQRPLLINTSFDTKTVDDRGLLLMDADSDGDLDLYIAAGGYGMEAGNPAYQDQLYLNNGKGLFTISTQSLPTNTSSKLCVRAADIDHDGDLDLFVSGRVTPHEYPKPVNSFIFRNDSKPGAVLFTDATASMAPALQQMGMACDALFTDYDNDGWVDLVLAGEWMPIRFLHNQQGRLNDATRQAGLSDQSGCWNSIAAGDFDEDGDIDYVAGNLGLNSFYRASAEHPAGLYGGDFDKNGSYDAVPYLYLLSDLTPTAQWKPFPVHGRDDMIKQMIATRRSFQNFKQYAVATADQIIPGGITKETITLTANHFASVYIRNDGSGKFTLQDLPAAAQFSAINGMATGDFDSDGHFDVAINTNDYGTDPNIGRYDALNGVLLLGNGSGGFTVSTMMNSGLYFNGNGKALVNLSNAQGQQLLLASFNKAPLKLYRSNQTNRLIRFNNDDAYALLTLKNGKKKRIEAYYGHSFLSQGERSFFAGSAVTEIAITNSKGIQRHISK